MSSSVFDLHIRAMARMVIFSSVHVGAGSMGVSNAQRRHNNGILSCCNINIPSSSWEQLWSVAEQQPQRRPSTIDLNTTLTETQVLVVQAQPDRVDRSRHCSLSGFQPQHRRAASVSFQPIGEFARDQAKKFPALSVLRSHLFIVHTNQSGFAYIASPRQGRNGMLSPLRSFPMIKRGQMFRG